MRLSFFQIVCLLCGCASFAQAIIDQQPIILSTSEDLTTDSASLEPHGGASDNYPDHIAEEVTEAKNDCLPLPLPTGWEVTARQSVCCTPTECNQTWEGKLNGNLPCTKPGMIVESIVFYGALLGVEKVLCLYTGSQCTRPFAALNRNSGCLTLFSKRLGAFKIVPSGTAC
ncbi:hypothetical protein TWF481_005419 [Arthrobotrys musiformis]|uniref:Uncharacterized protein n=1 Tax=Arthrobotrys musiformis TaxID=47236 RepID=A0AAV9WFE1_9PEZI